MVIGRMTDGVICDEKKGTEKHLKEYRRK